MTLKFTPGNHQYRMDGKRVPSVTGLLKGGLPKDALMYWAARTVAEYVADNEDGVQQLRTMGRGPMVAALKGVPWEARDAAALTGTDIHALGEAVVHGAPVDVPEQYADHVTGYARWLDDFHVVPLLTERSCGNRAAWYAGRFDLIADLGDTRWLLDVKTGRAVYGDTALQLDAYRNTEFYVDDDDPDTEHPIPAGIERLGVIHVTQAGTSLYPACSDGTAYRLFKHVAYIAERRKAIDAMIGEPLTTGGTQ